MKTILKGISLIIFTSCYACGLRAIGGFEYMVTVFFALFLYDFFKSKTN